MLETCRPMDIEARSFEIITELLGDRKLDPENAPVIKRAIHTTADFDYADNLSLIHISEPTRRVVISYAVFCLKKFFFNDTATTEIYTRLVVGSVRCV